MFNIVKTIYNTDLINSQLTGTDYTILQGTTLNEKFGIIENVIGDEKPTLKYFTIGMPYEDMFSDNSVSLQTVKHDPIDGALFKHVPFLVKTLDSDISGSEREGYRLRVEILKDGIVYVLYYMKIINVDVAESMIVTINNNDGILIPEIYETENVDKILEPIPIEHDTLYAPDDVNMVVAVKKIKLKLTGAELNEIKEAMLFMYPDEEQKIGEIGLCSGVDVDVNGYPESAYTQMNYFIKMDYPISEMNVNEVIIKSIDLGGLESLAIHV